MVSLLFCSVSISAFIRSISESASSFVAYKPNYYQKTIKAMINGIGNVANDVCDSEIDFVEAAGH